MRHKNVDIVEVRNNPNKRWDLYWLSCNKELTVKDIETLKLPNSICNWNWNFISKNISIKEVRNNPNKPWNKNHLSLNKTITVWDVETLKLPNSEGCWDWIFITLSIDIQEIINNPNKPWHRGALKRNNGITDKILEFFDAGLLKHLQRNIGAFKYHTDISIKCE